MINTEGNLYYNIDTLEDFLQCIKKVPKTRKYFNIPAAFDIEVYSWYDDGQKRANMYVWQFGINGHCFIGRTWGELKKFVKAIRERMKISINTRLVVYVHNLSYEYQFLKKHFKFVEVFEVGERKTLKAVTSDGIEFRCSYMLSGKSLEATAKDIKDSDIVKLNGYLDYSKPRHSKTPLTDEEIAYCLNDIKILMLYIGNKIEEEGNVGKIPLTNTGYVRRFCKHKCFGKDGSNLFEYNEIIKKLKLNDEEYSMCKDGMQGGYVHCNYLWSDVKMRNISSYDFGSSYIYSAIGFKLPMSSPTDWGSVSIEQYEHHVNVGRCCLARMTFKNIRIKEDVYFPPISVSKCENCIDIGPDDNGRLIDAEQITITFTEYDYKTYKECYDWEDVVVDKLITFSADYLPTRFIDAILELYEKKTKYKGIPEKELEYMILKSMLNSSYGMCVTDILKQCNSLDEYNNKKTRFLYYPWGLWIAAISRRNLYTGILECGRDLVYCDTDSIKTANIEAHSEYISKYNTNVRINLQKAMEHHGFDMCRVEPEDIKGEKHLLGAWYYEETYDEFKGLRAKAYISKTGDKYTLTLSGVNKKLGVEYLKTLGDPIDNFTSNTFFPAEYTGKLIHTYIDDETSGEITDYLGKKIKYNEKSSIHMEPCEYDMNEENLAIDLIEMIFNGTKKR